MAHRCILLAEVILCSLLTASCSPPAQNLKETDTLMPNASFIFKGKVLALHTSTTDEENIDNSGVVEVTEVIDAPPSLRDFEKQQVTVRFRDLRGIKEGEELVLFTEPYWFGETLGVNEKGSIGKGNALYDTPRLHEFIAQGHARITDNELRRVLKSSPVVVSGKVVRINEVTNEDKGLTEHDAEWKEAEIEVDQVLKGDAAGKILKVMYASGRDVMFFRSPKLAVGDEGIFMVQTADVRTAGFLHNDRVITDPSGFLKGRENLGKIKSLLK